MARLPFCALLPLLALSAEDPSDWPQWRGPSGDGLSRGTPWSPAGVTRWSVEVGLGYSAPVVADGRVFAFGFDEPRARDVLRALGLDDGQELWRAEWPGELRANQHEGGTLSTPAVAAGRVYTSSSAGVLTCHAAADGELLWRRELAAELEIDPGYYGLAGSPLVLEGRVFVAMDRALALDALTGELLWRSEPLAALYASPARFELAGEPLLAFFGQLNLDLLARADGAPRASFPWKKDERRVNAASPVVVGERLFVSSAYEHGCALVEFGADGPRAVFEHKGMRNKMAGCVLAEGALFGFDESVLKCLDLAGVERWRVRGLGNGALSGGDGKLAILSSSGELIVARASSTAFEELTRTPLFEQGVCWTPPTIAGARILCRNNRGTLVCRDHRGAPASAAPAPAQAPALPAAATLLDADQAARGGSAARARHPHLELRGTYEQRSVGFVPAPYLVRWSAPDRRRVDIQLPPPLDQRFAQDGVPGRISRVHDGVVSFELNPYRGDKLLGPAEAREERTAAQLLAPADWRTLYATAETLARERFDERECYRVEARTLEGRRRTLYFEVASGLLAGREAEDEGLVVLRDYRAFEGLLLPAFQQVFRPDGGLEEIFRLAEVRFGAPAEDCFARSARIEELLEERVEPPEQPPAPR